MTRVDRCSGGGIYELFQYISEPLKWTTRSTLWPTLTYDEVREDVSTTDSNGDVNPSWVKVCKKRSTKKAMRTRSSRRRST